jgi:hypothetical protein
MVLVDLVFIKTLAEFLDSDEIDFWAFEFTRLIFMSICGLAR